MQARCMQNNDETNNRSSERMPISRSVSTLQTASFLSPVLQAELQSKGGIHYEAVLSKSHVKIQNKLPRLSTRSGPSPKEDAD